MRLRQTGITRLPLREITPTRPGLNTLGTKAGMMPTKPFAGRDQTGGVGADDAGATLCSGGMDRHHAAASLAGGLALGAGSAADLARAATGRPTPAFALRVGGAAPPPEVAADVIAVERRRHPPAGMFTIRLIDATAPRATTWSNGPPLSPVPPWRPSSATSGR